MWRKDSGRQEDAAASSQERLRSSERSAETTTSLVAEVTTSLPLRGAVPATPLHASYEEAAKMGTPADATCLERLRDDVLQWFLDTAWFWNLGAVIVWVGIIIDGAWFVLLYLSIDGGVFLAEPYPQCTNETAIKLMYLSDNPEADYSTLVFEPVSYTLPPKVNGTFMFGNCTSGQYWSNMSIKLLVFFFTYTNFLPIAWRTSILVHVWYPLCAGKGVGCCGPARSCAPGLDFYGRPVTTSGLEPKTAGLLPSSPCLSISLFVSLCLTRPPLELDHRQCEALWFHLEVAHRRYISAFLFVAVVAQFANLATNITYWTYSDVQVMPGSLATNLSFGFAMGLSFLGGMVQMWAEQKVIDANPNRFPPRWSAYLQSAYRKYMEARANEPEHSQTFCGRACGWCGFFPFVLQEIKVMQADSAKYRTEKGVTTYGAVGITAQTKPSGM